MMGILLVVDVYPYYKDCTFRCLVARGPYNHHLMNKNARLLSEGCHFVEAPNAPEDLF